MTEEMRLLAEEMERECGDWWNAPGLSKEAYDRLMAAAEELDAQKFENRTSRKRQNSYSGAKH